MTQKTPEAAGLLIGALSFRLGGAAVYRCGEAGELWRLPQLSESVAEQLVAWGRFGVGGVKRYGFDADGGWLERRLPARTLKQLWSEADQVPTTLALRTLSSLAGVLGECEKRGLWPGALSPRSVMLGEQAEVTLRAEGLVRATLRLGDDEPGTAATRWTPPEQAAGAPWDAAANRYVLGLALYRLLAGEHPSQGQGLRLGLENLATRGAAPFDERRASSLPAGLQSYCLDLLAPSAAERPASSASIAEALAGFLEVVTTPAGAPQSVPGVRPSHGAYAEHKAQQVRASRKHRSGQAATRAAPTAAAPQKLAPSTEPGESPTPGGSRLPQRALVLIAPLVGLLWLGSVLSAKAPRAAALPKRPALAGASLSSQDCASCHPRQTAEWRRSVMSHSAKSPLFLALEVLIQEQVGRSNACLHGAGFMRRAGPGACRDLLTGQLLTGSAGEHWCVNCHAPADNLTSAMPPWDALSARSDARQPLNSLLPASTMEGISCVFRHQVVGPAGPLRPGSDEYLGNAFWRSPATGKQFLSRPEDALGRFGIANSGYSLDASVFAALGADQELVPSGVHRRVPAATREYLKSSEFCGACHDVRLFGTDVIGAQNGEHFKRLRNAYSEWRDWARQRKVQQQPAYSCQDCHMSLFPGTCVPATAAGALDVGPSADASQRALCPQGTRFVPQEPGSYPTSGVAVSSARGVQVSPHYFSGVDLPLAPEFASHLLSDPSVDSFGVPLGARQRRDILLSRSIDMKMQTPEVRGRDLLIALEFENTGAGHRVPAGFSQERELWLELTVRDRFRRLVYRVGHVDDASEDLHDKRFLHVNTEEKLFDPDGRPLGMFGADVADGPDVPRWTPDPALGGDKFFGRGLINFQNGFLRCVVCIGQISGDGSCQPLPGQETARADRYADGGYDIDTGRCSSNLSGHHALFETFFPVGSLDAARGVLKAPDAIIDTRSLAPERPVHYTYQVPLGNSQGPYQVEARLLFRAFPPFLLRAFIDYERRQATRGLRPEGPLIGEASLERLEIVELVALQGQTR